MTETISLRINMLTSLKVLPFAINSEGLEEEGDRVDDRWFLIGAHHCSINDEYWQVNDMEYLLDRYYVPDIEDDDDY